MNKRTIKSVKVAFAICLCIIAALFLYAGLLQKELNNDVKITLREISEQGVRTIYNDVDSEYNLIKEVSGYIAGYGSFDLQKAVELLKEISKDYPFKRMGIITMDGIAYTTDDMTMNLKDREYYEHAMKGETVLSDRLSDREGGDGITVYATPIYEKEEVIAVLFATYSIESFRNLMSVHTFEGEGYSYIVKQNGDVVVDSNHPTSFQDMNNIFDAIRNAASTNKDCSKKLEESMEKGESGYIVFKNKVNKYMYYMPLGVNDWYIMNVVPTSVAEKSVQVVMSMTYALCILMAGLSVLFIWYLVRSEKKKKKTMEEILYVDPLTGGYSYTKFSIEAKMSLVKATKKVAFITLDLDNFKLLNEMYGLEEGDNMLRYLYNTIQACSREDTLYARRMADVFVVLMYYDTEEELANRTMHFCQTLLKNQPKLKNGYMLKPSIGVYPVQNHDEDLQRMQDLASIARESVKYKHNEYVAYYKEIYRDKLLYNKQLEDQMEIAYEKGEFIPYFQPKYDTVTQEIVGAEALIRWKREDGTVVSPNVFIPLAESSGFIEKLDRKMFEMICEIQHKFLEEGRVPVKISVNLSRQVFYDKNFIDRYVDIMNKYDISTEYVELEITESALFENQEEFKSIIDELHERGFKILMDDFGVGYSSMMMLKAIPIDVMKLDKSFVDDYNDIRGREIIISVMKLAKALNILVTAEGVETAEQYAFFRNLKCDIIQGYYFAKPMPLQEFQERLKQESGSRTAEGGEEKHDIRKAGV